MLIVEWQAHFSIYDIFKIFLVNLNTYKKVFLWKGSQHISILEIRIGFITNIFAWIRIHYLVDKRFVLWLFNNSLVVYNMKYPFFSLFCRIWDFRGFLLLENSKNLLYCWNILRTELYSIIRTLFMTKVL